MSITLLTGLTAKHGLKILSSFVISLIVAYFSLIVFVDTQLLTQKGLFFSYYLPNMFTYWEHFFYPLTGLLLISFIAIGFDLLKDNGAYGDAHLATDREISGMLKKGAFEVEGIILARRDSLFKSAFVRTNEPLSTLICAPQDTGKTSAIIIPTLLSDRSAMIVNDVKGELWDLTSLQRSRFGDVGLFAPSENFECGLSFNPFHKRCLPTDSDGKLDWDATLMHVRSLAEILYPTEEDNQSSAEVHFNAEAKAVFMFYCLLLIHFNGETSLPEIYSASLETSDVQDQVAFILEEEEDLPKKIVELANKILQKGGEEWGSVFSTFTQKLEPFSLPTVAKHLKDCDFDYLSFRQDRPFTLYIYIPANRVKMLAPIIRVMVQYLMDNFLSDRANIKTKVTFMMDEFPRMGRMNVLKESPALQRGFNISSVFVAQDKGQLEATYGKDSFNYFCTVCDMKAVFNQNEDTTAAKFSSLVGKTTRKKESISSKDLELLGSKNLSDEGVPLLLPQDFMNIPKGHIYILIKNFYERPILAKCAYWFKDKGMLSLSGAYNGFTIEDELRTLQHKFVGKNYTTHVDETPQNHVKQSVTQDSYENEKIDAAFIIDDVDVPPETININESENLTDNNDVTEIIETSDSTDNNKGKVSEQNKNSEPIGELNF